ncbi:MAG: ATP-binding protein [Ignavibacteria bacterium]|nr:ATP-binding protein [Ignavibacteria bacterium]
MIKRYLNIDLPKGQSAFLWGARKTGKTTYIKNNYPESILLDLLKTDDYLRLLEKPYLFRQEILALDNSKLDKPIIIDEIQKVPLLLDEVHHLIESYKLSFILSGSSARKLKRGKANMLGGRAWRFELFPLTYFEIKKFELLRALNHGLIPVHYLENEHQRYLKSYVQDYLKEEIFDEGLVRNLPAFSRFLDSVGYSNGELVNYLNISRECGVDSKTVKEYYNILSDTLLGKLVEPFKKRQEREVIRKTPKFYLFDVGVAGAISKRIILEDKGEQFGKAFEHFIYMELNAHRNYTELDYEINFWRTNYGFEVDFILGDGEIAVEVKGKNNIDNKDLKSLNIFKNEYKPKSAYLVCNESRERLVDMIRIIPYNIFLDKLWSGEIIK